MDKAKRFFYYILNFIFSLNLLYFAVLFFTNALRITGRFSALPSVVRNVMRTLYLEEFSMIFWLISIVSMVLIIVLEFVLYRKVISKFNLLLPLLTFALVLVILAINIFLVPMPTYKMSITYAVIILLCTAVFLSCTFLHTFIIRIGK